MKQQSLPPFIKAKVTEFEKSMHSSSVTIREYSRYNLEQTIRTHNENLTAAFNAADEFIEELLLHEGAEGFSESTQKLHKKWVKARDRAAWSIQ